VDLVANVDHTYFDLCNQKNVSIIFISCETGVGISELISHIQNKIKNSLQSERNDSRSDSIVISRARHRVLLSQISTSLSTFLEMYSENTIKNHLDIAAEEIRETINCIGRITGRIDIEDILDHLFENFCIGK